MRRLILLLVLMSFSCGPIDPADQPMAVASERGLKYTVRVVVKDNSFPMHCTIPDAANDITCDVGFGHLQQNARSNWQFLIKHEADELCAQGLRTSYLSWDTVNTCSFALLRIRFTKLVPKPEGVE